MYIFKQNYEEAVKNSGRVCQRVRERGEGSRKNRK